MGTTSTNSTTLRTCRNCNGEGRIDVIKTVNRGNGIKMIIGTHREPCGTCQGSGRVAADGKPARYFMLHNMTDGSIAAMATSASPWQVLNGPGGQPPSANEPSLAADFVRTQNDLRHRRAMVGLAAISAPGTVPAQ